MEFIEIIEDSRFSQDRKGNHSRAQVPNNETVGARGSVKMIGRLTTPAPGHVLADNRWVSRDIFLQEWKQSFHSKVSRAPGISTLDNRNSLTLEKGSLRKSEIR